MPSITKNSVMRIPDSISAMVYTMRHPVLWTVMVWAIAVTGYTVMAKACEEHIPLAFAAMGCIAFVGCMPLIRNDSNTLHWVCGIGGCVLSQLWCVLALISESDALSATAVMVSLWAAYLAVMLCARFAHWCFWMELWCMAGVLLAATAFGGP